MRPKSESPDFKLLVSSKYTSYFRKYRTDLKASVFDSKMVQLQKSGTVFQPRRVSSSAALHPLSRIGKQCTNMLEEYDTWSQDFNQATKSQAAIAERQTVYVYARNICYANDFSRYFNQATQIFKARATYVCLLD